MKNSPMEDDRTVGVHDDVNPEQLSDDESKSGCSYSGDGIGCALIILAFGVAIALMQIASAIVSGQIPPLW